VDAFLMSSGFLGTKGTLGPDLTLVLSIVAAVLLTVGVVWARRRSYQAHRWIQTTAVCLNAVLVIVWMVRSFRLYVLPDFPADLSHGSYALTTVHAVAGLIGVILGVFIVIRGNQLMASGRSLAPYRTAMRTAYLVYMAVTVLGVVLYVVLYG
jgi:uncharacterized membrane protein YozB (DUF420 family)